MRSGLFVLTSSVPAQPHLASNSEVVHGAMVTKLGVVMADVAQEIARIADGDALCRYLNSRPLAESQALAFRCALRIMPLTMGKNQQLVLYVFRALLLSWAVLKFPKHDKNSAVAVAFAAADGLAVANDALASNSDHFASRAAFAAAASAFAAVATSNTDAANAGSVAAVHAFSGGQRVWSPVLSDLLLMHESSTSVCLSQPLWSRGSDLQFVKPSETEFHRMLESFGSDWSVVRVFYESLSEGRSPFADLENDFSTIILKIAKEDKSFWARSPDIVMRDIAARLNRQEARHSPETLPDKTYEKVDFFISYSTTNEAEAREINSYLESAGYTTIVQFKDFVPGSNFVTEMQKGLQADRFVALLSPAYIRSKQCQAEWNTAYNRDPSGEERHLIQIMVEKCDLPPLAKQIVYKSIHGVSGDARRVAVLEAVGMLLRPEVPSIHSPYEFETTPRGTISAVAGTMNDVKVLPSRDPGDAQRRLQAARDIANDLISGLGNNLFQVRHHYVAELENYRDRLPFDPTESIYSADAALRNLRDDLEGDLRYGICDRFAARLQRLIEIHYGVRVYFPELLEFYDDVKQARQVEPAPLEALSELRKIVHDNTPDMFEASVSEAFDHAVDVARPTKDNQELEPETAAKSSAIITLPPDPIAGVDPIRAAQHAEMSMQNSLWGVIRRLEEGGKAIERVDKVVSIYAKWIDPILDWLSNSR